MKKIAYLLAIIMALSYSSVWAEDEIVSNEALDPQSVNMDNAVENNEVVDTKAIEENEVVDEVVSGSSISDSSNFNFVESNTFDLASQKKSDNFNIGDFRNKIYLNDTQWKGKFDDILNRDDYISYNIYYYIDGKPWAYGTVAKAKNEDKVNLPEVTPPDFEPNLYSYGWCDDPVPPSDIGPFSKWNTCPYEYEVVSDLYFYGFTVESGYERYEFNYYLDGELYDTTAQYSAPDGMPEPVLPSNTPTSFTGWYYKPKYISSWTKYDGIGLASGDYDFYGYTLPTSSGISYPQNKDCVAFICTLGYPANWNYKFAFDTQASDPNLFNEWLTIGYDNSGHSTITNTLSHLPEKSFYKLKGISLDPEGTKLIPLEQLTDENNNDWLSDIGTVSNFTVYCQWEPKEYTITYYKNDGTEEIFTTQTGTYEDSLNLPNAQPTREGYTFDYWEEEYPGSGEEHMDGYRPTKDLKVYAKWIPVQHTVSFYMNDGTSTVFKTVQGDINGFTVPSDIPTRENYTFDGWYYDSSCTDKVISENTRSVTSNLSVYAKWIFNGTSELSITKTVDKLSTRSGDTLTYTITVSNSGTAVAKNVVVEDALASNLTFVSATNSGTFRNNKVTWTLPEVANGSSVSVKVVTNVK